MEMSVTEVISPFRWFRYFPLRLKNHGRRASSISRRQATRYLNKFTSNPVLGVIAGIVVTILIQSSSGTTVITIGLVTAGFMTLKQAIGVIMGANIGTTVTAFIIGIDFKRICNANFSIRCIFNLFL